jgi:nicotinamidase/pyrazinamidase
MKIVLFTILIVLLIIALILTISFTKLKKVTQGKPIKNYPINATALLIIDVQKNLVTQGERLAVDYNQARTIIENINKIIDHSVEIDYQIIYIKNIFRKNSVINYLSGRTMEDGSPGTEIDERIKIVNHNIFEKHQMDSFTNHEFEKFLIENEVSHLIIVGLDAADCVDKTIKGALNRGYKVTVVGDAIASKTDEKRDKKINDFRNMNIEIIDTKYLLN